MPLPNIVRRVRIYKLLRTGLAYSEDELASLLRVGRRTIRRDLAVLRQGSDRFELAEANGRRSIRLSIGMLEPSGFRC
ncbi:MAG TPA: HTH domain-containing protein [Pirellulales bacterium]|jgi:predicted DNA-binding transcriptional regulator YafY|nr:HTH domain-containing protein [Pirellulales bacterium]